MLCSRNYRKLQCYAGINGFSGVLHFAVLPAIVKRLNNQQLWLIMPTIMLVSTSLVWFHNTDSIHLISASFVLMKAMEYSIRGVTTEMVYVSLDYESRFLGKEIIGGMFRSTLRVEYVCGFSFYENTKAAGFSNR